jgi:HEAT repeat protein
MAKRSANKNFKVSRGFLYAATAAVFFASAAGIYDFFHVSTNSPRAIVDGSQHSVSAHRSGETIPFRRQQESLSAPARHESIWSKVVSTLTLSPLQAPGEARTKATLLDLSATLREDSLHLKFRRRAAWALAKICDDESIAILEGALTTASCQLKSSIAEALGHCPNPDAAKIIASLLFSDHDEIAVRGAIRGLGVIGDVQSVQTLGGILFDDRHPVSVRSEAALALGEAGTWEAYDTLVEAFGRFEGEEVLEEIVAGLGAMEFERTEWIFQEYLNSARGTGEQRAAAIEALANASGNPAPFLLEFLKDKDPEVRAAAAWSLSMTDISDNVRRVMTTFLTSETNPEVRLRITQAVDSSGQKMHEQ